MNKEICVEFIKEKHKGQLRKQGTEYYTHPVEVAKKLEAKNFSQDYIITGLFHDLLEDTDATVEGIEKLSNKNVVTAVELLTKKEGYIMSEYIENIKNNDIAHMVKLADRIHNLSESYYANVKWQEKYIKETEEWYIELSKGTIFESDIKTELDKVKKRVESLKENIEEER